MRKLAKVLAWLLGGLVALLILLGLLAWLLEPDDIPPPDVSDLAVQVVPDEVGRQACELLVQAGRQLEEIEAETGLDLVEHLDGAALEERWELLQRCEDSLALQEEALALGNFNWPALQYRPDEDLDYLRPIMLGCRVRRGLARAHLDRGEVELAAADALLLLDQGTAMARAGGLLVHGLVAGTVGNLGVEPLRDLARVDAVPATTLTRLANALLDRPSYRRGFAPCLRGEAQLQLGYWEELAGGDPDGLLESDPEWVRQYGWLCRWTYVIAPRRCQAGTAAGFRVLLQNLERPLVEFQEPPGGAMPGERGVIAWVREGNVAGEVLLEVLMPVLGRAAVKPHMLDAERGATALILALRAYHLTHGKLPASLDDLVPDLLGELPMDPYDGLPLGYDPEERCVYSRARDGELHPALDRRLGRRFDEGESFVYPLGF
jgi:hypothetical protein